jgi:hypothetical protein
MSRDFKSIGIDDWEASLIIKNISYGWKNQPMRVAGMLRLFPEWNQTQYKSPQGDLISLTLKFSSYKDWVVEKFIKVDDGDIFFIRGIIDINYSYRNPDFDGETKHRVDLEDIYSGDKSKFSNISNVAVLVTS